MSNVSAPDPDRLPTFVICGEDDKAHPNVVRAPDKYESYVCHRKQSPGTWGRGKEARATNLVAYFAQNMTDVQDPRYGFQVI